MTPTWLVALAHFSPHITVAWTFPNGITSHLPVRTAYEWFESGRIPLKLST